MWRNQRESRHFCLIQFSFWPKKTVEVTIQNGSRKPGFVSIRVWPFRYVVSTKHIRILLFGSFLISIYQFQPHWSHPKTCTKPNFAGNTSKQSAVNMVTNVCTPTVRQSWREYPIIVLNHANRSPKLDTVRSARNVCSSIESSREWNTVRIMDIKGIEISQPNGQVMLANGWGQMVVIHPERDEFCCEQFVCIWQQCINKWQTSFIHTK